MTNQKPLVLVSNDDGVTAPGLHFLIKCLRSMAQVIAVAPDAPRSGQSSAITVDSPLRIATHGEIEGAEVYSVNGTPADCVKLALFAITPRRPDIILTGVNHGSNSGNSVIYSGTMGAAIEGCVAGIPSAGLSLIHHSWEADFSATEPFVKQIAEAMLRHGLPPQVCLNVNFPAHCTPRGLKVTTAAAGHWEGEYERYADPSGRTFYMLGGEYVNDEPDNDSTDLYWLKRQWGSVTPVCPDQTSHAAMDEVSRLLGCD